MLMNNNGFGNMFEGLFDSSDNTNEDMEDND